jgi:hypothetical protein
MDQILSKFPAPHKRLSRPALEDKNMTGEAAVANFRALSQNLLYNSMENFGELTVC